MGPLPRPTSRLSRILLLSLWLGAIAVQVSAQDTPPAHLAVVDGYATLESERGSEPAVSGIPMVPGDRLRTTGGRVEVLFPDGSALDVDEYTTVDLQSDTLLRLIGGRLRLSVPGATDPASALRFQIDSPVATVHTEGPGDYRISLGNGSYGPENELFVLRGAASLISDAGSILVRAGERSFAREHLAPAFPQVFNSARFDAFDRWADERRAARLGTASTQYLPPDLRAYGGTFDRYGSWQYESTYGYVWYPTVASTWRPYYAGYWTTVRPYGWTWIGVDSWSYPTHHYGRWGFARSRWFWIPDRRWAPAWVSWAASPGYVSWCPLGFDNRPVFSLTIATGNPWAGWVVLPRNHFGGHGRFVQQYALASPGLTLSPRTPLVVQASSPVPLARAIPRSSVTGSVAVPRANASRAIGGTSINTPSSGARAIPRQGAAPAAGRPAGESPISKLPAGDSGQRVLGAQPAAPAVPSSTPTPGATPYGGRTIDRGSQGGPPSTVAQPGTRAAVPRVAMPRQNDNNPDRNSTGRPSTAVPAQTRPTPPPMVRPEATTPSYAPEARPGMRSDPRTRYPSGSPGPTHGAPSGTEPSMPMRTSPDARPVSAPATAVPRSAPPPRAAPPPRQSAPPQQAAPPQQRQAAPSGGEAGSGRAPATSPPAGARSAHRGR